MDAEGLVFRERAGVAVIAGEVFVGRVDVEELVTFCAEVFQLSAAALRKDRMAGVTIARSDRAFPVGGLVQTIVTAEATRPIPVRMMGEGRRGQAVRGLVPVRAEAHPSGVPARAVSLSERRNQRLPKFRGDA